MPLHLPWSYILFKVGHQKTLIFTFLFWNFEFITK
jgi:hypothetical protein